MREWRLRAVYDVEFTSFDPGVGEKTRLWYRFEAAAVKPLQFGTGFSETLK